MAAVTPSLFPGSLTKPGLRERQRQARGEAILQAAFALITEQGYDALTMEALAECVGISRQTLYHHFASKEDIALRAVLALMEQGQRAIEEVDASLPPGERFRRVARWLIESRFSPDLAPFVRARSALLPIKSHPEYQRAFERRTEVLTQIVQAAQGAGEIEPDVPPALVVQMLLGLVSTAAYEGLIAAGQVTSAQVVDAVLALFFRGLQPASRRPLPRPLSEAERGA